MISLRKCVGCNQMKDKEQLIRIVRTLEGHFCIDTQGHMQGRGAYICANKACLEKAKKHRGLERSFKAPIDQTIYEQLACNL